MSGFALNFSKKIAKDFITRGQKEKLPYFFNKNHRVSYSYDQKGGGNPLFFRSYSNPSVFSKPYQNHAKNFGTTPLYLSSRKYIHLKNPSKKSSSKNSSFLPFLIPSILVAGIILNTGSVYAEEKKEPLPPLLSKELKTLKSSFSEYKKVINPFPLAHFLESLNRSDLTELIEKTKDPRLELILLQKDAIRVAFEECLISIDQESPQKEKPTCFICFSIEPKVGNWLKEVLVPDLDKIGIKPIFCFRDLRCGYNLPNFEKLAFDADQVIVVCTPDMKQKTEGRIKKGTFVGVALELRYIGDRLGFSNKSQTIFPIYFKGDEETSCPTHDIRNIFSTMLDQGTDSLAYYQQIFHLFGTMRGISRERCDQVRSVFEKKVNDIFSGKINTPQVEEWRKHHKQNQAIALKKSEKYISKKLRFSNLPSPPTNFTGREKELEEISKAFKTNNRIALVGMGGAGKTALACQFAQNNLEFQFTYFVPAETPDLIQGGLIGLANELHIPAGSTEKRLQELKTRLERLPNQYLIVFDGLDNKEALLCLEEFLPENGKCLLITSRMPEQPKSLGFDAVPVESLSPEEATAFLLKSVKDKNEKYATLVARELGYLPLALTHAASYIRESGITFKRYLRNFKESSLELFQSKRLNLKKNEKTILTTWEISLKAIEREYNNRLVRKLLSLLSFSGQVPIPLSGLEEWFKNYFPDKPCLDLQDALQLLRRYSLIENPSLDFYSVHTLVQQVSKNRLDQPLPENFLSPLLPLLSNLWKYYYENQSYIYSLGFIEQEVSLREEYNKLETIEGAEALGNLGKSVGDLGSSEGFEKALELFNRALSIKTRLVEDDSLPVSDSYVNLSWILLKIGRYKEALEAAIKSAKIREKKLGADSLDLAHVYDQEGKCWDALGNYEKALEKKKLSLTIKQKSLKENSKKIATSYNFIAYTLGQMGSHKEAIEYNLKALKIREKKLGKMHPSLGESNNNTGLAYCKLGEYQLGLEYLEKALVIFRTSLPEGHIHISIVMNNISRVLARLGRPQEALPISLELLSIFKEKFGEGSVHTAYKHQLVGSNYYNLGRYHKALKHYQLALKTIKTCLGKDHVDVANALKMVGFILNELGEFDKALEVQEQALEIRKKLGPTHPSVGESYLDLGFCYGHLEEYEKAVEYHKKALEISDPKNDRMSTPIHHEALGCSLKNLGKLEEALKHLNIGLRMTNKDFPEIHPWRAASYGKIGLCLDALNRYKEALDYRKKSLKICLKLFGSENHRTAIHLHNFAKSLRHFGKYEQALEFHLFALGVWQEKYGRNHHLIAGGYGHIGTTYAQIGELDKGLEYQKMGLELYKKKLGNGHSYVGTSHQNISKTLFLQGKQAEALTHAEKALDIFSKIFNSDHYLVLEAKENIKRITQKEQPWKVEPLSPTEESQLKKDLDNFSSMIKKN